jgi:hypothetical protein
MLFNLALFVPSFLAPLLVYLNIRAAQFTQLVVIELASTIPARNLETLPYASYLHRMQVICTVYKLFVTHASYLHCMRVVCNALSGKSLFLRLRSLQPAAARTSAAKNTLRTAAGSEDSEKIRITLPESCS